MIAGVFSWRGNGLGTKYMLKYRQGGKPAGSGRQLLDFGKDGG